MSDDLLVARLDDILGHIGKINGYFSPIGKPEDFLTGEGIKTFDAVSMRLQVIGESLKKVENTGLFEKYPEVEWSAIIRLRELISHHYDKLEHEIIYDICNTSIPAFKKSLQHIISDLRK